MRRFFFIFYLPWQGLPIFNKAEMHFAPEAHSIVTQNLQSLWEIAFSALDSIIKLTINRISPSDFTIFCIFFILSGDSGKKNSLSCKTQFSRMTFPGRFVSGTKFSPPSMYVTERASFWWKKSFYDPISSATWGHYTNEDDFNFPLYVNFEVAQFPVTKNG